MIPPQTGATPAAALALARILGDSRFGIRQAGAPPSVHRPHVGCHGLGCFPLSRCIGLGVLLGQLTRMHDDKTPGLRCDAPITVFDRHLTEYTLAMPAPGDLVAGPPGLLEQEGAGRRLLPPGFECLADGTGARD
jgi:hypothetical protein